MHRKMKLKLPDQKKELNLNHMDSNMSRQGHAIEEYTQDKLLLDNLKAEALEDNANASKAIQEDQ